ncbi:MAG: hypothetical protein EXR55_04645 [Dehalococcoidia bacterium]|nr:hypothetical protein [Dehalococcoidia bacterium]
MRWRLLIPGVLVALLGLVWTLQGFNVLKGSGMSDQSFWAGAGIVALLIGVAVTFLGLRKCVAKR